MKLISMVDFVLQQDEITTSTSLPKFYGAVSNYAEFLNQPLTLGMFVPCDEKGNVLSNPRPLGEYEEMFKGQMNGNIHAETARMVHENEYQQAKERVLFEDYGKWAADNTIDVYPDIESLTTIGGFTLTKSALKQIGL